MDAPAFQPHLHTLGTSKTGACRETGIKDTYSILLKVGTPSSLLGPKAIQLLFFYNGGLQILTRGPNLAPTTTFSRTLCVLPGKLRKPSTTVPRGLCSELLARSAASASLAPGVLHRGGWPEDSRELQSGALFCSFPGEKQSAVCCSALQFGPSF